MAATQMRAEHPSKALTSTVSLLAPNRLKDAPRRNRASIQSSRAGAGIDKEALALAVEQRDRHPQRVHEQVVAALEDEAGAQAQGHVAVDELRARLGAADFRTLGCFTISCISTTSRRNRLAA